ncbi:multi-sensor signal transduction histidine kinase [Nostoc sp. NIES-2111]|nr:multi-sensor signal transduction histidine kinase [Nostoc sp. NIES-2111]
MVFSVSEFIKNISDRQTKLSLRTILIIPFVLQIFAVVSLTGYLSFKNGQQAVNSITTQLLREISLRVEQNLENFLAMPHKINQQNTNYIKLKQLDVQDFSKLEKHFYEQLKVFDTVSLIGFATKNQELISSERFPDDSLTIRVSNKSTNYNLRTYTTDSQGKRTGINDYGKPYDPRRRYWYNQPIKTGKQVWSEIYPHNSGIALYVAASQPVYDNQGNLQGVLLSNLNLSKIGTFLNSLNIGKTGISFIIERPSGTLVATSTDEKPFLLIMSKHN